MGSSQGPSLGRAVPEGPPQAAGWPWARGLSTSLGPAQTLLSSPGAPQAPVPGMAVGHAHEPRGNLSSVAAPKAQAPHCHLQSFRERVFVSRREGSGLG